MLPLLQAQKLKRSITLHEKRTNYPYLDTAIPPRITIGIGYNLSDRGIDDDWIDQKYNEDVNFFYNALNQFSWFKDLNYDRQIILIDMAFMGWKKFLEFKDMLSALAIHNYAQAANEMLNSEWAKQVKTRATTLAEAMLTGSYTV